MFVGLSDVCGIAGLYGIAVVRGIADVCWDS